MRGTCDIQVSKMLCLHIPSLIPQHFSTIDVASTVQAAAVAGAGLLYEGSCHRMMTEFLLNEIGKRPSSDGNILDREAYTLACGVALGMVNLCKGGNNSSDSGAGLEDLRIEERLYRYVVGGLDDEEMRRRREESDRLGVPSTSAMGNNERCSCIYEGESINTDVTAPGATLALGLMYMRSGNKTIASTISLPDTHFLLGKQTIKNSGILLLLKCPLVHPFLLQSLFLRARICETRLLDASSDCSCVDPLGRS